MSFDFSRNSTTNLESHFLNHPACFFPEQTTDRQIDLMFLVLRYPAHCTGLELIEPPQNKICYRLHPKYTPFFCFPIICFLPSGSLYFYQEELLMPFLISWKELTECYSKLLLATSATYRLFSCTFHETMSIDLSKKVYLILYNIWVCSKNVASSHGHCLLWLSKYNIGQCQLQSNLVIAGTESRFAVVISKSAIKFYIKPSRIVISKNAMKF